MIVHTRRRSSECASDLRLDQALAGELSELERHAVELHLQECAPCRRRFDEFKFAKRHFVMTPPRALAAAPIRRRRWGVAMGTLAAAAAVLLIVRTPGAQLDPPSASVRIKGGARIGVFVRRGHEVFRGSVTEPVFPGDGLRFEFSYPRPAYVALIGIDKTHLSTVYYPQGPRMIEFEGGKAQLLDSAVELDETLGTERFYGVFCQHSYDVKVAQQAIQQQPEAPHLPPDCEASELQLTKLRRKANRS